MNFREWKLKATTFLLRLRRKYNEQGDDKAVHDIDFLLSKLHYLRARELSSFLHYCHVVIRDTGIKEIAEIIPSMDEVVEIITSKED